MKKALAYTLAICITLLVGTGIQWMFYAVYTETILLAGWSFWGWIFQVIYWITLICIAIQLVDE